MRSTLFFIPHSIGPLPVAGFGWLLFGLIVAFLLGVMRRRGQGATWREATSEWFGWAVAATAIAFLLPRMEPMLPDGQGGVFPIGIPIRGYGLFLMLGVVGAVWMTWLHARRQGLSVDSLMSLSLFTVIGGLIGARLFFVIQKWSELKGDSLFEKLLEALKFTEGGLVVFGSFIGGAIAVIWWALHRKYRLLVMGDMIVAGLMLGLAMGRLGCFMNGCCYGGVCETSMPAVHFPRGSLPYMEQLMAGRLLGLKLKGDPNSAAGATIESLSPGSWASEQNFSIGDRVESIQAGLIPPERGSDQAGPPSIQGEITVNQRLYRLDNIVPQRSLPTHPTQLYSSLNAFLICGFLFFLWPNAQKDGLVLGLWLVMCGSSRMLEEWLRIDEAGQFGTVLTISQWISLVGMIGGVAILAFVRKMPFGRARLVVT
jgi:phosphatidylglycerol---prolipoprotein diacylglyceryl transferase